MLRIIGHRVLIAVPVLLVAMFLTSSMARLIPGDPSVTILGENATPAAVSALRAELGLDRTIVSEYGHWLLNLAQGDLGRSLFSPETGMDVVQNRLPVTISLDAVALVLALVSGVGWALLAAARPDSALDRFSSSLASVGLAVPSFWLGTLLIYVFALRLGLFPPTGYTPLAADPPGWLRSLLLPAVALAVPVTAEVFRQLRTSLSDVLASDYVRTAYAKGASRTVVLTKHALKNAAAPMVTVLGFHVGALLGGAVIIEQIFALPGIGSLAASAVLSRDIPMIQVVVLVAAVLVQLTNLAVDIMYGYLNPKVRAQ